MGTRRPGTAAGYTLAEGLVSLGLLGLMALLLMLGVAGAAAFPARGQARMDRLDDVVAAQTLLRTRLERSFPERDDRSSLPYVAVRGTTELFDFAAPGAAADGPREYQRHRIAIDREGRLTLWTVSPLATDVDVRLPDLDGWRAQPLLEGVARLRIDYYGAPGGKGARGWRTAWLPSARPPELVRVRITFPPGDPRVWPDLIVRPRATTPANCQVDAATGGCVEF